MEWTSEWDFLVKRIFPGTMCRWQPGENRTVKPASNRRPLSMRTLIQISWFMLFLLLLSTSSAHAQQTPDPSNTNSTTETLQIVTFPSFSPQRCRTIFDTSHQISYVCGRHRDLFPVLLMAEEKAKLECERQFKNEFWNCSGFSLLKAPNITRSAYKEAAFVHALSVAAIAHTVAKGCAQGVLSSCSCDTLDEEDLPPTAAGATTSYRAGCSDNVDFGLTFAENFLNKRYGPIGLKEELDKHNFRVGRHIVREIIDSTPVKCTCHGISGACTFQTCLTELPDFTVIGDKLKQRYNEACKVKGNGRTGNQFAWVPQCGRSIGEKDFLYQNNPPNWCIRDPYIGSLGVVGRVCDPHSTGPNSCRNLCVNCGRTYREHKELVQDQCKCWFHFCCEIRCHTCQTEKIYHTCT